MSQVQDLIAVYRALAARCDYALHLGLTEAGMGSKGIVASTAALAVLLQEGIGDTIRVSLTPEPGGDRTREVQVAQEILQTMGLRAFTPMVSACPGCGRTTSTVFQELADKIQAYLRAQMPVWRETYPGVEEMRVAVMGCVVNGPGESKHADIGISLPGTGEVPVAPVYVDGKKTVTLKGERIAEEFQAIVEAYVSERYGEAHPDQGRIGAEGKASAAAGLRPGVPAAGPAAVQPADRHHPAQLRALRLPADRDAFGRAREVLTSKGGVEKEIYALTRLAEADDDEAATKGALRFDLTVPLARYVAMRERELAFPFRRYQIQRVWRGETPQARKGRFREFYQCDIDIINREKLSYLAEAEIPSVIYSVFREMAIGEFTIRINNRKVLQGLLQEFGSRRSAPPGAALLDKTEKEDGAKIREDLEREGSRAAPRDLFGLIWRTAAAPTKRFPCCSEIKGCAQGLEELRQIVEAIRQFGVPDVRLRRRPRRGARPRLLHRDDLRDHARRASRARQHLLGRALRRPRELLHRHAPARGGHLDRADAPFLQAEGGRLAAAAGAHAGRGAGDDHGPALPGEVPRLSRRSCARPGSTPRSTSKPAKLGNQLTYADRKGFRIAIIAGEMSSPRTWSRSRTSPPRQPRDVPPAEIVSSVQTTLRS